MAPRFRFPRGDVALAEARWTNFYLAYQGRDDLRPQKRYGEFLRRVLQPAMPEFYEPRREAHAGGERIRVGFLSHFFYNCTVGRYFASWLTGLDRSAFEVVVYYTNEWVADDTQGHRRGGGSLPPPAGPLDVRGRAAGRAPTTLDILVYPELGMHPETFTLANLRLAPVQCAGWGHPDTHGPRGHRLVHLLRGDGAGGCAAHLQRAPRAAAGSRHALRAAHARGHERRARDFGLPEGKTLYLLPQSLFKIHPDNDELVAEVLHRDPERRAGRFRLAPRRADQRLCAPARREPAQARPRPRRARASSSCPSFRTRAYLRLNELCDVMLDTLHWSGGNTSLDALASGLPVVTMPGELMRGRQSRAMLTILEAGELVAADSEDYVRARGRGGARPAYRRALSERIRANHGLLFDRDEPLRALERFFEVAVL